MSDQFLRQFYQVNLAVIVVSTVFPERAFATGLTVCELVLPVYVAQLQQLPLLDASLTRTDYVVLEPEFLDREDELRALHGLSIFSNRIKNTHLKKMQVCNLFIL